MDPIGLDEALDKINQVTVPAVRELLMAMVAQIRLEGDTMRKFIAEERGQVVAEIEALRKTVDDLARKLDGASISLELGGSR